jgi:hypothetical protein
MALALVLALPLGLAACAVPREIDPFVIYDELTGDIDAGRERPPGMDRPYPSLGTVPARPDRPDARTRAGLTSTLEADRGQSLTPLPPRATPAPPAEATDPGTPPVPAAPPAPPRLVGAVAVPWVVPGGVQALPPGLSPGTAPALPEPGEVPAGPTPDLLAAPPPRPQIQ